MLLDSNKIADTIIALAREREIQDVTNLKLQKLLYYSQAWNLAIYKTPLFFEAVEAWIHGPVVPLMFRRFKAYRWSPIDCSVVPSDDEQVRFHIGSVLDVYGKLTASQLERITHSESPWKDARHGLEPDEPSSNVITHSAMRDFYGARLATPNA